MGFKLSEKISEFAVMVDCAKAEKIKLAQNTKLTDAEFERVSRLCDIFTALGEVSGEKALPPKGGEFWDKAHLGVGPYGLHVRRDRYEIDHLTLLNTRFRDYCSMAYEFDHLTSKPDFWVRRYQRLTTPLPAKWRVKLPARFGEIGWSVDGFPVNRAMSVYQERITAMYIAGVTDYIEHQLVPRILEIGGGAGELGYVFSKALPNCTWYNADLLGCLIYSAIRLAVLLPEKSHYVYVGSLPVTGYLDERMILRSPAEAAACKNAIIHIPHFLLDDFVGHLQLHLAYNAYSFAEMPSQAVAHYASLLSHFLREEGVLVEQNGLLDREAAPDVIAILSDRFQQWSWGELLNGPYRIQNGPIRTWYLNPLVKDKVKSQVNFAQQAKVIESLNDDGDTVDIHYPEEAWDKVGQLFPKAI